MRKREQRRKSNGSGAPRFPGQPVAVGASCPLRTNRRNDRAPGWAGSTFRQQQLDLPASCPVQSARPVHCPRVRMLRLPPSRVAARVGRKINIRRELPEQEGLRAFCAYAHKNPSASGPFKNQRRWVRQQHRVRRTCRLHTPDTTGDSPVPSPNRPRYSGTTAPSHSLPYSTTAWPYGLQGNSVRSSRDNSTWRETPEVLLSMRDLS